MIHRLALLPLAALATACTAQPGNEQTAIGNAVRAEEQIADDANERADRLDEASAELESEADRVGGAAGRALRNESDEDLAAAAQVRAQGQTQSVNRRDAMEQAAGVIGNGN